MIILRTCEVKRLLKMYLMNEYYIFSFADKIKIIKNVNKSTFNVHFNSEAQTITTDNNTLRTSARSSTSYALPAIREVLIHTLLYYYVYQKLVNFLTYTEYFTIFLYTVKIIELKKIAVFFLFLLNLCIILNISMYLISYSKH